MTSMGMGVSSVPMMTAMMLPPGALVAGALIVGAGLYELTPIKRACRRRCREGVRSGPRFGVHCFGSSVGPMLVLVAVDVMSVGLMCAIAVVVLAQKLLSAPSRRRRAPGAGDRRPRHRHRHRRNLNHKGDNP